MMNKKRVIALMALMMALMTVLPGIASAATMYVKTTNGMNANVRTVPSTMGGSSTVKFALPYGAKVQTISSNHKDANGTTFYYIKTSTGKYGYIASYLLTSVEPGTKPSYVNNRTASVMYAKTNNGGPLNLRSNRNNNAKILTTIPYGAAVSVKVVYDDWLKVTYKGTTGYAKRSMLVLSKPTVTQKTTTPTVKAKTMTVTSANGGKVNFRKTAGGKLIDTLKPGTKVTAYYNGGTWTQVKYNGKTGYIMTKFLK